METTSPWTPLLLLANLTLGPMTGLHIRAESSSNLLTSYIAATKCQQQISITCWTFGVLLLRHTVKHRHSQITRIYIALLIPPPSAMSHGRASPFALMALGPMMQFHLGWMLSMMSGSVTLVTLSIISSQTLTSTMPLIMHPIKSMMQTELVVTTISCLEIGLGDKRYAVLILFVSSISCIVFIRIWFLKIRRRTDLFSVPSF